MAFSGHHCWLQLNLLPNGVPTLVVWISHLLLGGLQFRPMRKEILHGSSFLFILIIMLANMGQVRIIIIVKVCLDLGDSENCKPSLVKHDNLFSAWAMTKCMSQFTQQGVMFV